MRRGIQLGFAITFLVLIGNAVFAVVNTSALVETEARVAHTHDVLRQLQTAHLSLRDAEADQRDYLLTGDETYVTSYRAASGRLAEDLTRVRRLASDDAPQLARLDALEPLVRQRFGALGQEIEVRRNGGPQAVAARLVDDTAVAAAIREAIGAMEDEERALLTNRSEQAGSRAGRTLLAFGLVTVLALAALLWEFEAFRRDVRRRDLVARELLDQREQYSITLASIGDGVIVTDDTGRVTFLNPVAERLTGWGQDAVGNPLADVFWAVSGRTREPVADFLRPILRGEQYAARDDETELVARGGAVVPIDERAAPLRDGGGALVGAVIAFRDVTDRRRAVEAAREQAALLDEATDAILVEDPAGRITYWNRGAERFYGWSAADAVGRTAAELFDGQAAEREEALAAVAAFGEWAGELRQHRRNGAEVVVASRWTLLRDPGGRPRAKLVIASDVTDRRKLEAQLLRAQRLESIGTLAGGIAHDLNNVLTPILMGLDILRESPAEAQKLGVLETVQAAAQRGADLVKQVLLFSRGADGPRAVVLLPPLLREIERMLTHTLPKLITVRTNVSPDLWPAPVDPTQFIQVVMNLCVNARDAMPNGGDLFVQAENLKVDEHYAKMHMGAKPGRYVTVAVADTGEGIPPDVQARMFDPFFTTKPPGQGTGLGLPTALGIVRGHGGFVNVYSEPGQGARFVVGFPAAKSSKEQGPKSVILPITGNGETILVVDDEAAIAQITRHTLEAHGYTVLTAADGSEAVEVFRQHPEVKAVLTDMMMPVMDGPATIKAIRRLDAAVPFIAASGLTDPGKAAGDAVGEVSATLSKPFTARALLKTVQGVLRAGRLSGPR
jgi:PAS domain S-box-containing protein